MTNSATFLIYVWTTNSTFTSVYVHPMYIIKNSLLILIDQISRTGRHLGYIQFGSFGDMSYFGDHLPLIHLLSPLEVDKSCG